jgi:hypothetical protein
VKLALDSVGKHGFGFSRPTGEAKLAAELNVVSDPFIYLNHKLIEISDSYKSRPDDFCPLQVDRLD